MDVHDIKTEVTKPKHPNDLFRDIYRLQEELLKDYKKIEKMPDHPLNLDIKEHQLLVKDFIGRVIEELAEAEEQTLLGNSDELFMEELSDALHFLTEILVLIFGDYNSFINAYHKITHLRKPMEDALNQEFSRIFASVDVSVYRFTDNDVMENRKWMWVVTRELKLAGNGLRNKPWKQTEVRAQKDLVFQKLMVALVVLIKGFRLSPMGVYSIYWKKNQVNRFRIKSKY